LETSGAGSGDDTEPGTKKRTGREAMTVRRATGVAVALSAVLALVMVAYAKVAPGGPFGPSGQAAFRDGQEAAQQRAQIQAAVAAAADGAGATVGAAEGAVVPEGSDAAIPTLALRAYQNAASWAAGFSPGSHLPWSVIAGIGRLESNHGRFSGSAARFTPAGDVAPEILGPALDGRPGFAAIRDTDGGSWDRDRVWDRAVGPMQFIPSTWKSVGRDGSGDGTASPHNLFDAAMTTAAYLCSAGGDLADPAQLRRAVFAYNHSMAYVTSVLRWAAFYDQTGPIPGQDPVGGGQPGSGRPRVTVTPTSGPTTTPTSGPTTTVASTTSSSTTTIPTTTGSTSTPSTTGTSDAASTPDEGASATSGVATP
jgi:membrane-bound lytic murein transglycosylase B